MRSRGWGRVERGGVTLKLRPLLGARLPEAESRCSFEIGSCMGAILTSYQASGVDAGLRAVLSEG